MGGAVLTGGHRSPLAFEPWARPGRGGLGGSEGGAPDFWRGGASAQVGFLDFTPRVFQPLRQVGPEPIAPPLPGTTGTASPAQRRGPPAPRTASPQTCHLLALTETFLKGV